MSKKIIALLLSVIMIISLVGCGSKNTTSFTTDPNDFTLNFGENDSENSDSNSDENDNQGIDNSNASQSNGANNSVSSNKNNSNSSNKNSSSNGNAVIDNIYGNKENEETGNTSTTTSSKVDCKHTYLTPTCEQPKECEKCGYIAGKALGHKFVNGVCSVCNAVYTEWYNSGVINITKKEVDEIVSMQYKKPKNVIIMIGDGMGPNDLVLTEKKSSNCFDFGLVLNQIKNTGFATTRSASSDVTDSAASGTALATGYKTTNGYVGMSVKDEVLTNITEIARSKGKKVGIVTNDELVGATPAAFAVHVNSREAEWYIAKSFVEFEPDVLIGQGYSYFRELNLNRFVLAKDFASFNDALNSNIACNRPFLGFFSENTAKDKSSMNTLSYCTEVALNRLKKNSPKGFFLMIENTTCDNAGHSQDIAAKMTGVVTLDRAVATVLKFMKNNPDTLLIVTSDHDNGGIKIPEGDFTVSEKLFTANGHTGINVRTFAVGYGAEYFNGKTVDNTDIAKFAIDAVKKY